VARGPAAPSIRLLEPAGSASPDTWPPEAAAAIAALEDFLARIEALRAERAAARR
jgi:hypothetical protein